MYEMGLKASEVIALNTIDIGKRYINLKTKNPRKLKLTSQVVKLIKEYNLKEKKLVNEYYNLNNLKEIPLIVGKDSIHRIGYHTMNKEFKNASEKIYNKDGSKLSLGQLRYAYIFNNKNQKDTAKKVGFKRDLDRTYLD